MISRQGDLPRDQTPRQEFLRFLRFGVVGTAGLCVDTATVYALRGNLDLYGAGAAAYVVAASCNWWLNRTWTFRDRRKAGVRRQWLMFLAANLAGFVLNRGTYATLIATLAICRTYPVLAIAAGSVAGLFVNFALSRRVVFR